MSTPSGGLPSLTGDYFDFFGIPHQLDIDLADLQLRFYALSRQLHPDHSMRKSEAQRQYSLDATAILNDGYRILRDPVQRAEYVLKRAGLDIGEQQSKNVPPELLEEVFELNMAIEELRSGGTGSFSQLEEFKTRFAGMLREIETELAALFGEYDESGPDEGKTNKALAAMRGVLNRRRYVNNLVRDVEQALTSASPV